MATRVYTLNEARKTLPRVRRLMGEVQSARAEILRLRPEAWPALRKAAGNGGNVAAGQLIAQFTRLEAGVKGIGQLGVLVKDTDSGLVDFVARRQGREVYLCWRYGEDELLYWHDIQAGFAGRQMIRDDEFEE
ncbi:MAG: DUF2203 domain-containing protein [Caldilineaceae bacterium]|nr:DUF2203 domain-containing protein [Caldilineaceae bacterium]